jgi:hypothetical protein
MLCRNTAFFFEICIYYSKEALRHQNCNRKDNNFYLIGDEIMKRSTTLLLPVLLLVLASCGTPAQYSQQRFPDGIYTRIGEEPEVVRLYSEEDFENMAAANIAKKHGRDTLVIILDDPWDFGWYSRYNRYHYAPWLWGGLGFSSYYWSRYYGSWYDPFWDGPFGYGYFYSGWYDPWYYGYYEPWYYDPWYTYTWGPYRYGYGYGWYGHRYGWYDSPSYHGGYWGGSYRGRDIVYTPRSTTTVGGSRERRPGSGVNYRYGAAGSAGGTIIRGGTNVRPNTRTRSTASASTGTNSSSVSGDSRTTAIPAPVRTREQGYNPSRSYQNKNSNNNSSRSSGNATRSYSSSSSSASRSSSSSSNTRSSSSSTYSNNTRSSSSSSSSYGGGASRSVGGGGGGASHSSGNASHSGGGGASRSGGGRR